MHDLILAGVGAEFIAIEPAVAAFPLHAWFQGIFAKRAITHDGLLRAINARANLRFQAEGSAVRSKTGSFAMEHAP
jgi:hypothetical protein